MLPRRNARTAIGRSPDNDPDRRYRRRRQPDPPPRQGRLGLAVPALRSGAAASPTVRSKRRTARRYRLQPRRGGGRSRPTVLGRAAALAEPELILSACVEYRLKSVSRLPILSSDGAAPDRVASKRCFDQEDIDG